MRKPQNQPRLAILTLAEREQLADWLRHEHYDAVLERVVKPRPEGFGLDISKGPLQTFYAKVALLDVINARLPDEKKMSLAFFESLSKRDIHLLTSTDHKKLEEAHQAILDTSADLATSGDNTPAQLAALQRLVDFPERAAIRAAKEERADESQTLKREMHAHKIKMDEAHLQLAQASLTLLREKHTARASKNSALSTCARSAQTFNRTGVDSALGASDALGPLARNWEEVRARAQKAFGITPEESARRAELRRTWKDPNDESLSTLNSQPSASATQSSPLNLINLLKEITNAPNPVNPANPVKIPNDPSTTSNNHSSIIPNQSPHLPTIPNSHFSIPNSQSIPNPNHHSSIIHNQFPTSP